MVERNTKRDRYDRAALQGDRAQKDVSTRGRGKMAQDEGCSSSGNLITTMKGR